MQQYSFAAQWYTETQKVRDVRASKLVLLAKNL